ncbi:ethanolamine permease, partial [Klebsiella pneumoniae]|nr:ethanolamine permease [Klebsiella pneumoniae]
PPPPPPHTPQPHRSPAGVGAGPAAIPPSSHSPRRERRLTACIVTMSVFGAIVMYITSMAALFKLRRSEPKLIRPFRAPLYPLAPAFALGMAVPFPGARVLANPPVALIFSAWNLGGALGVRQ